MWRGTAEPAPSEAGGPLLRMRGAGRRGGAADEFLERLHVLVVLFALLPVPGFSPPVMGRMSVALPRRERYLPKGVIAVGTQAPDRNGGLSLRPAYRDDP